MKYRFLLECQRFFLKLSLFIQIFSLKYWFSWSFILILCQIIVAGLLILLDWSVDTYLSRPTPVQRAAPQFIVFIAVVVLWLCLLPLTCLTNEIDSATFLSLCRWLKWKILKTLALMCGCLLAWCRKLSPAAVQWPRLNRKTRARVSPSRATRLRLWGKSC